MTSFEFKNDVIFNIKIKNNFILKMTSFLK